MRTLACLAAVMLAGVPAAASPILIDDITTTGLLPVEQLLTDAGWPAFDPDDIGSETSILADAMGPGGWDHSTLTRELLRVEDSDSALSRYSLEPADAREPTASPREPLDASPPAARRDVERAAMSHVQPAALTLVGVCLALAFAGGREWRRRNWHRRHMRRRG